MTTFVGFGQAIDTILAVPGAISSSDAATGQRCIRINDGPEKANSDAPLYTRHDNALVFSARDVGTYRCEPNYIAVSPCPGSDSAWVTGLLLATALPATLWMQGKFVLHAAGIILKGANHAIAIAGPSGSGKSLLAAQLLDQGACLLGDDSLALEVTDAGISASGLPGGIHTRIGHSEKRRFEPVAPDRSVVSAPLGAIIVLGNFADAFACMALSKMDAIEKIITNQHRPRIPFALERVGPVLGQAAAIAEQVPVNIWRRRNDQTALSPSEHKALMAMMR